MTENEIRKRASARLKADGWAYWYPPLLYRLRGYERDIFGVFDLIAMRKNKLLFIQLTTRQHVSERRRKIQAFMRESGCDFRSTAYIWAWDNKNGGFDAHLIEPDNGPTT